MNNSQTITSTITPVKLSDEEKTILPELICQEILDFQQYMITDDASEENRAKKREELGKIVAEISPAVKVFINTTNQQDVTEFLIPIIEALFKNNPTKLKITTKPDDASRNSEFKEKEPKIDEHFLWSIGILEGDFSKIFAQAHATETLEGVNFEKKDSSENEEAIRAKRETEIVFNDKKEIVFALNRFNNEREKIKAKVNFDEITTHQDKKYNLTAFIVHRGDLINNGHYIAYIKEKDKNWYCYDDHKKNLVNEQDQQFLKDQQQAYVVKYSTNEAELPAHQKNGTPRNISNRCWMNSSLAFLGSFTTISRQADYIFPNDRHALLRNIICPILSTSQTQSSQESLLKNPSEQSSQPLPNTLLSIDNSKVSKTSQTSSLAQTSSDSTKKTNHQLLLELIGNKDSSLMQIYSLIREVYKNDELGKINDDGKSLIHIAVEAGNYNVIPAISAMGSKYLNQRIGEILSEKKEDKKVKEEAVAESEGQSSDQVKTNLENQVEKQAEDQAEDQVEDQVKINYEEKPNYGMAPLHLAIRKDYKPEDLKSIKLLLMGKADVNIKTIKTQSTPIQIAYNYELDDKVQELLLENGAEKNQGEIAVEQSSNPPIQVLPSEQVLTLKAKPSTSPTSSSTDSPRFNQDQKRSSS